MSSNNNNSQQVGVRFAEDDGAATGNSNADQQQQIAVSEQGGSAVHATATEDASDETVLGELTTTTKAAASTMTRQQQLSSTAGAASASAQQSGGAAGGICCPSCGSDRIEQNDASGCTICTDCGVLVEENQIVSAVEFVETGGASSMVGQFVSATSSKAYTGPPPGGHGGGIRGGRYGFSRDSRETTLANGRRRIQEIASRLRLAGQYVDAAHRLFTIAVEKNFVQGRRTVHVVAACLYIACRQDGTPHMLIDFSDALQVNVYTLGTCFLKFRRLLGLKLKLIDPALYVYRFAAHLGLHDKVTVVAQTALRLVGRMKRDWIVAGRRPAGICAAALLIAARAHGFGRQSQDVTRILRVCGFTVNQRVKEFEQTPSAALSLAQFQTVDLEAEADPPIFRRNKIREARAKAIDEGNVALLSSGALDDPNPGKKSSSRWREPTKKVVERQVQFQELYKNLDEKLSTEMTATTAAAKDSDDQNQSKEPAATDGDDDTRKPAATDKSTAVSAVEETAELTTGDGSTENSVIPAQWEGAYPKSRYGSAIILPNHATEEERRESNAPLEAKISLSDWKEEMPTSLEDELDCIFRDEEEEKQKEAIFNKMNKDYLEKQERKETERLNAEAKTRDQEKEDATQAAEHAKYKSSRNRKRSAQEQESGTASAAAAGGGDGGQQRRSTEEQLVAAVSSRKISRKINYEALSSIFAEDGSFSTEAAADDIDVAHF